jgi:predicted RNA-binding Zn-ribbon protein involved in translation (DUF1610 family)
MDRIVQSYEDGEGEAPRQLWLRWPESRAPGLARPSRGIILYMRDKEHSRANRPAVSFEYEIAEHPEGLTIGLVLGKFRQDVVIRVIPLRKGSRRHFRCPDCGEYARILRMTLFRSSPCRFVCEECDGTGWDLIGYARFPRFRPGSGLPQRAKRS